MTFDKDTSQNKETLLFIFEFDVQLLEMEGFQYHQQFLRFL